MAKRRQVTEGEPSERHEGRRRKLILEESSSDSSVSLHIVQWEKYLRKGDGKNRQDQGFKLREIEMERAVNVNWLQSQKSLEIGSWLTTAGWKDFVTVVEPVYPRLVRTLYANLDPTTMISNVGACKIKMDETVWCKVFNIPTVSPEEEAPIRSMQRNEIFRALVGEENVKNKVWINASSLPKDASVRLAMNIIMNVLLPRKRNKDQIKEREGRILYGLMHGRKFNIGREIVNHIRQVLSKKSLPLCFPMHLMRILQQAKVELEITGTAEVRRFKDTSLIDGRTLGRLGFKKDHTHWNYVGRGNVKEKPFIGSPPAATPEEKEEGEEDEQEEEHHEPHFGHEEFTPSSAMPGPSTSTRPPPTTPPHLTQKLTNLQASIAHLSTHLTEKLDYLSATIHSKLESMDSKLDDLQRRVQSCEIQLNHLTSDSPFPSPTYSSPYSPSSPSYSPPTTPIEISSSTETTPKSTPTSSSQPTPLAIIPPFHHKKVTTKRSSSQSKKPGPSA